ncbi:MAG TPA: aspartyl-phosphate phosphatase Spo0E family protein [Firmicutes bacterium]|nr:aspartyl-phosphate phosphatase Spo0E family protein [Bacillota bacterium]
MNSAAQGLEELRRQLNALLERVERLNDPEVLALAKQLDRLMAEEMGKQLPPEAPPPARHIT